MAKNNNTISGIILAGGEGKRAGGRDKGLISYQGRALIEHVIEKIKPQVDDIVISANRNITSYQSYAKQVISDVNVEYQGPLAGISACLRHCKHHYALVVACDMPVLPDSLVSQLHSRLAADKQNSDVVIASVAGHHQLAMLVNIHQADVIQQRLQQSQRKLIQWVESVNHAVVNFDDDADAFTNINKLSDCGTLPD